MKVAGTASARVEAPRKVRGCRLQGKWAAVNSVGQVQPMLELEVRVKKFRHLAQDKLS